LRPRKTNATVGEQGDLSVHPMSAFARCSAEVQIEVVERHIASGRIGNLRCPQTTKRDSIGPVIERLTRNWRAASSQLQLSRQFAEYPGIFSRRGAVIRTS